MRCCRVQANAQARLSRLSETTWDANTADVGRIIKIFDRHHLPDIQSKPVCEVSRHVLVQLTVDAPLLQAGSARWNKAIDRTACSDILAGLHLQLLSDC